MNNLIFTVGLCGLVGGIAGYFGHTQGRDYEGNLRCQESGMEQHFRHDFPGYDPIEESPKDERLYQKLGELREGYLSGDIFEHVEEATPAEQADAYLKGRAARKKVEESCAKNNKSY